ncbi:hypothetical protein [Fimbriimonas ginsengisoli]|uniref:Uncharacterized protein n=1 Tax=Fimbriimonas ginsengisoli Gsoil 348 TaxID=661478 RepID=A0A068NRM4_FIMGI|nr:hypothetical protein [Fimbriimonas ginsengisoli]AIE85420.1 hypothetical protein OP10G_2052 [Fimbriimonas ginsengisoli Gsoil 348]
MSPILSRILRESEGVEVLELLSERLSPTDLQSLLLEVARRRSARLKPAQLLAAYESNRFVRPSPISPTEFLRIDALAFEAARDFEPIELSTVCPLGASSVVATVDQNKVVSTMRGTEVVSDCTNVMALEAAVRRRSGTAEVRLCCSHRLVRAQEFKGPHSFAHFKAFALCSAGRDRGNLGFEREELQRHLQVHLRILSAGQENGWLDKIRVALTDFTGERREFLSEIGERLSSEFNGVRMELDPDRQPGRGYYDGICFGIYADTLGGEEMFLADGGFTNWTRSLLSNHKERLLISGMGIERICSVARSSQ